MIDDALHALARILLRLCSVPRAHAILGHVGALLPQRRTRAEVWRAAMRVRSGTCLSRALAVVARAPDAEMVIGVAPRAGDPLFAHAWLEQAGEPIDPADVAGHEIARLRRGGAQRGIPAAGR
jgi:hypothetical protein